jgi:malonate transporter
LGQAGGRRLFLPSQWLRINGNVLIGVLIKNVLQAVMAYGIVRLLHIPDPIGAQCVMLVAIPAGFFGMVFGAAQNVKSEEEPKPPSTAFT